MKAQDFLIGVRDFFAMLVPGSLLLFVIRESVPLYIQIGTKGFDIFAFAIASYLLGATALGLGSILDIPVDKMLHSTFFRSSIGTGLSAREKLAEELRRDILSECPPPFQSDENDCETTKAFWRNYLRLNSAPAIAELDRLEALQKMHRTLVAVFASLLIFDVATRESLVANAVADKRARIAAIWLGLTLVAFVYYAGGRWRYLEGVYSLAIAFCVQKCPK
jgi:hypothetical protein